MRTPLIAVIGLLAMAATINTTWGQDAVLVDTNGVTLFGNGVAVNEFSNDTDFVTSAGSKVPTKAAVKAYIDSLLPSGVIAPFAGPGPAPAGWLMCDGQAVSRTTYPGLFATIGTTYGAGDGSSTFNLPDLRGEFLRGADGGRGVDSGRALGSTQGDQVGYHGHPLGGITRVQLGHDNGTAYGVRHNGGSHESFHAGGNETRPRNVAVNFIIRQ